eukprot:CCRYP_013181-RA/>CCRYP_013181-RA protein AED:0.10 eAED:0.10 QI:0/-1/0/1/-1/1/1/0/411
MIPRMSYLHLALSEEVLQLFEFAPASGMASAMSGNAVTIREEPPDDDDSRMSDGLTSGQDKPDAGIGTLTKDDPGKETSHSIIKETKSESPIKQSNYPKCWFEDEATGEPLRWHLFVGVLYDSMKGRAILHQSSKIGFSSESIPPHLLPWKLKVHFTAYPTTLLPLDVGMRNNATPMRPESDATSSDNEKSKDTCKDITQNSQISSVIGGIFRNSLKQALFMQYSSSKMAMSMTKKIHEKMWNSILSTNFTCYHEVNIQLQVGIATSSGSDSSSSVSKDPNSGVPELIPVRVMLNRNSPMQKPCRAFCEKDDSGEQVHDVGGSTDDEKTLDTLVKHLSTCNIRPFTALGDVLLSWLPLCFEKNSANEIVPRPFVFCCIQGIQPSMSCPMLDLWKSLCHPDHFLYIIVVTKE